MATDKTLEAATADQLALAERLASLLPAGSSYLVITEDGLINSFDRTPAQVLALALIGVCGDNPARAWLAVMQEWAEYQEEVRKRKMM